MVIYKTTNLINGKFYIGKDAKNRNSYLGSGKILKQAIEKYGIENFKKEILEVCSSLEELDERERFWIRELNAIEEGYNLTDGGTGGDTWSNIDLETHWNTGKTPWNKGKVCSKQIREKISQSKKQFFIEHPEKKVNSGTFLSGQGHKEFGKKQDVERIKKRLNTLTSNGVYSKLKETMKGNTYAKQRPVKQFDLDGNFINEYNSVTEAANAIGIARHRIYFVLQGKQNQTGGYTFEYK